MVASGECGEEIDRRFGRTGPPGYDDIEHRDGTSFLRFFATEDSDVAAYTCEVVKDETQPSGFRVVDVSRGR